jgi:molybdopterin molybdotransferase
MLEVAAALEIVLGRAAPLPSEVVPLPRAAGRVLAEPVASDIDSPPYTKALMDGYAIRSADTGSGTTLTVIEEVAAGRMPTRVVGPGEATRIMTGAPIPDGADAVIPHEETETTGRTVRLSRAVKAGESILPRGREMRAGEVVVPAGTRLKPQAIGLLAAVGRTSVSVHRAPRLAILATGDELVEAADRPGPGQIRNSNGPMLSALASRAGAVVEYLGIAPDERDGLRRLVARGLDSADAFVLAGGVSAGKFDLVPEVLKELGVTAHFHKIRLKPGKPLLFGSRESTLVFGLPGNPVSSFVGFELFVRPALRKMMGDAIPGPTFVPVPLAVPFAAKNDRPTYAPARLETTNAFRVRPGNWFGSADLRGLLTADALVSIPAGSVELAAGELLPTLFLSQ